MMVKVYWPKKEIIGARARLPGGGAKKVLSQDSLSSLRAHIFFIHPNDLLSSAANYFYLAQLANFKENCRQVVFYCLAT